MALSEYEAFIAAEEINSMPKRLVPVYNLGYSREF